MNGTWQMTFWKIQALRNSEIHIFGSVLGVDEIMIDKKGRGAAKR
jgi:hypothetical protein